jgi:hypothetical protein
MSLRPRRLTPAAALSLALLSLGASTACAQAPRGGQPDAPVDHAGHAAHAAAAPVVLTATARRQLDDARRAVAALGTPAAARAAGYRPVFGQVPLQGEHYVRTDLVFGGAFDVERPSVLMFAPVRGTPTLVGLAYAFLQPVDAPVPRGFDGVGDEVWHGHDGLVPMPGRRLMMMHVWLTDAPDGPFARYNPWLPYRAAGLTPPSAATLADSAAAEPARRLGFALAVATQPPLLFDLMARRGTDTLRTEAAARRAAIEALVPRLVSAEQAGDRAAFARLADQARAEADAFAAAYRRSAGAGTLGARLVDRTVDEFLGRGHGVEEELGALLSGRGGAAAGVPPHP